MRLTWSRWVLPSILAIAAMGIATYSVPARAAVVAAAIEEGYTVAAVSGREVIPAAAPAVWPWAG